MTAAELYPLAKLIQKPSRPYVPSWAQDCDSLKETFARARRSVGKTKRVRVEKICNQTKKVVDAA